VHNLWKAGFDSSFLSLRILARDGARTSPLQTVASFSELPALETPGSDSAGLSPIRVHGAREKCDVTFGDIHTRCTVFPQHGFALATEYFLNFIGINERIFCWEAEKIDSLPLLGLLKTLGVCKFILVRQTPVVGVERELTEVCFWKIEKR
jgi:hypothetical protein